MKNKLIVTTTLLLTFNIYSLKESLAQPLTPSTQIKVNQKTEGQKLNIWDKKNDKNLEQSVNINFVNENKKNYCIPGEIFYYDKIKGDGLIFIVDDNKKVNTHKIISTKTADYKNSTIQCLIDEHFVYFVQQVSTNPSESLNQSLLYILKYNKQGKEIWRKNLPVSFYSAWSSSFEKKGKNFILQGGYKTKDSSKYEFNLVMNPDFNKKSLQTKKISSTSASKRWQESQSRRKQNQKHYISESNSNIFLLLK